MRTILNIFRRWDHFWVDPASPRLLGAIRLVLGFVLFYNFLAYFEYLETWFGPESIVPLSLYKTSPRFPFNWSYLWYVDNPIYLYVAYGVAVVSSFGFAIGYRTPITGPLTCLQYLMFLNRNEMILFGFDEVCMPMLIFLIVGRSGDAFSLASSDKQENSSRNRVALRLIQLHLCFIYLSAGLGKLHAGWLNSDPIWLALATQSISNFDVAVYQYIPQSVLSVAGKVTVFWELFFIIGVWFRQSRLILLGLGFATHIGIGVTMMLAPFSAVMIAGLLSFFPMREEPI